MSGETFARIFLNTYNFRGWFCCLPRLFEGTYSFYLFLEQINNSKIHKGIQLLDVIVSAVYQYMLFWREYIEWVKRKVDGP